MTKIITSDEELRMYIPNAFRNNIPGAFSLFEKILPFIIASEEWVINEILGSEYIDYYCAEKYIMKEAQLVVALDAYKSALPSLDVVVSHNGVGVVETNTLKPASKAKMDALYSSLSENIDTFICSLIKTLARDEIWQDSYTGSLFTKYIFENPSWVSKFPVPEGFHFRNVLDRYDYFRPLMRDMQERISREWISPRVMDIILNFKIKDIGADEESKNDYLVILSMIRQAMAAAIVHNDSIFDPMFRMIRSPLESAVNTINNNKKLSRIWANSETGRLFRQKSFANSKNSSAYWF